jgi:hypothetical protein
MWNLSGHYRADPEFKIDLWALSPTEFMICIVILQPVVVVLKLAFDTIFCPRLSNRFPMHANGAKKK